MHTIEIPDDHWSKLMDELGRENWIVKYLELASNSEEVWLKIKPRHPNEPDRTFRGVLNKYAFIKEIHREVLKYDSRGKHFTISEKGVRIVASRALICNVIFT